ncbi:MAG TPA: hypothetical protein VHM30_16295 [Gemmatimonadaceae bacterium]|nr:hypothetical protein [Gemmatimonadaceae bacterium]
MRLASALLFVLAALAPTARAQSTASRTAIPAPRSFAHHETIQMGYHEPSGYGLVELRPMLVGEHPEIRLSAMYNFKGRALSAPPEAVGIAVQAIDAPGAFGAGKRLVFTLDDGTTVTTDSLITVVDQSSGHRVETRSRKVLRRDFLRIVSSTRVTARAGTLEFTLGEAQLEALRDFASRMTPAAHAAALAAASAQVRTQSFQLKRDWYEAKEVDSFARPSAVQALPPYPPGVERRPWKLAVRYVVDTSGHVDPASFEGMDPADSAYVAALRQVIPLWEFKPAEKDGKHVRQIIRQVVTFEPTPGQP